MSKSISLNHFYQFPRTNVRMILQQIRQLIYGAICFLLAVIRFVVPLKVLYVMNLLEFYYFQRTPQIEIRRVSVPIDNLPASIDKIKIVQISDLHWMGQSQKRCLW